MSSKRALNIFKVQFYLFAHVPFLLQLRSKFQRHLSVLKAFSFRKVFKLSKLLGKSKLLYKQYIVELPSGLFILNHKNFSRKNYLYFFLKKPL